MTATNVLLLRRFTSVTKATLKGTLIIGAIQGTICGIAFALAGIQGPVFWGTVMAVMSIIPRLWHRHRLGAGPDHSPARG